MLLGKVSLPTARPGEGARGAWFAWPWPCHGPGSLSAAAAWVGTALADAKAFVLRSRWARAVQPPPRRLPGPEEPPTAHLPIPAAVARRPLVPEIALGTLAGRALGRGLVGGAGGLGAGSRGHREGERLRGGLSSYAAVLRAQRLRGGGERPRSPCKTV